MSQQQNVVRVRYNARNVWKVRGVQFLPGLNMLTRDQYDRVSRHPAYKRRLENGKVEVVTGRSQADLTPADVAELYDVKRLRALAEGDNRKLANAALKQLDRIDEASRKKDGEGQGGGKGGQGGQGGGQGGGGGSGK